jgi:predicted ATP-dependent endonuclease of OLD family
MLIEKAVILNYQSCRDVELAFPPNSPAVFIGINDSGKTSILRAVGLLLNPTAQFAVQRDATAKRDLSNTVLEPKDFSDALGRNGLPELNYTGVEASVLGKIRIENGDLDQTVTDSLSNHLLWTIEKSTDSFIWIAKVFNGINGSQEMYLLSFDGDPSKGEARELWAKKSNELKAFRTKLGVGDEEVENINKAGRFTNLEQMRPLYGRENLVRQWSKYNDFKKDLEYFPQYRYLNWDFNLDDLKKIANDAMKGIIDRHTQSLRQQATGYSQTAESEVNQELAKYVPLLQEDAPTLTGLKTKILYEVKPSVSDILINKLNADKDIHLDSQGEGVKRQIWFGLIRMAAERSVSNQSLSRKQFLWCFDEPETHLYPAAQRKFFEAMKKLAGSNFQILLSTHSTIFTDRIELQHLHSAHLKDGYTAIGRCEAVDEVFASLQVRNSDFLYFDKFFLVEGDTEATLFPHLYKLINGREHMEDGIQVVAMHSKDKRDENIKAIRKVFNGYRKEDQFMVIILDGDARYDKLSIQGLKVHYIGKQDIEDSMHPRIWLSVLNQVGLGFLTSEDAIRELIEGIPKEKVERNQKFLEGLRARLKSNAKTDEQKQLIISNYPKKGKVLGDYLKKAITREEDIPDEIRQPLIAQ